MKTTEPYRQPVIVREAEISGLRRAMVVERRAYYADLQGKRTTFSKFMRQTAEKLARRYPLELVWSTVRGLFRDYANADVGTRISIVKRAEELLQPFWTPVQDSYTSETGEEIDGLPGGMRSPAEYIVPDATKIPAGPAQTNAIEKDESRARESKGIENQAQHDRQIPKIPKIPKIPNISKEPKEPKSTVPVRNGFAKDNEASAENAAMSKDNLTGTQKRDSQNSAEERVKTQSDQEDQENVLLTPVRFVKGVGSKLEEVLGKIRIATVGDLLRHYPRRHLDFQNRLLIKQLQPGMEATIFGTIRSVGAFQSKRRNVSVMNIVIGDETGSLLVTRFVGGKSNRFLLERYKQQYPKGSQVLASGVVDRDGFSNRLCLKNCEIEILAEGGDLNLQEARERENAPSLHAGRLVPIYPLTEGLSLRHFRNIVFNALQKVGDQIVDPIPDEHREKLGLLPLVSAYRSMHFPEDIGTCEAARRRLVFDELFAIQLHLAKRRHRFEARNDALVLTQSANSLVAKLLQNLPFQLTGAQERVFAEVARDLASPKPMHRLVQGDVGSGKTIVALLAFMVAIDNQYQGVMMAPTEILAEQHYRQFQKLITPLGLKTALVVGKQGQKERRSIRQEILSGQVHIAVGTHALLEEDVEFQNLGLIIIDEQHRFGVKQRARLKLKSQTPELLTMTATPIPRTMALTMHGDLDVSEIDEMPPGRKPIETKLFRQSQKKQINSAIEEQLVRGRQVYIVFPLIDESESLSAKAATIEFERLRTIDFPQRRVGLMHGKLSPQEKEEVMESFRKHELDILVCTTVIEVGVDVPNASLMVIENADRFGLAQLHQLRGRVGRGSEQSYCYLVSDSQSESTLTRLEIMTQTNDGFVIAEKDLELRGPGEFLGYRQSGLPDLVLTDIVKDAKILEEARNMAIAVIREDPELVKYASLNSFLAKVHTTVDSEIARSG